MDRERWFANTNWRRRFRVRTNKILLSFFIYDANAYTGSRCFCRRSIDSAMSSSSSSAARNRCWQTHMISCLSAQVNERVLVSYISSFFSLRTCDAADDCNGSTSCIPIWMQITRKNGKLYENFILAANFFSFPFYKEKKCSLCIHFYQEESEKYSLCNNYAAFM